MTHKLRTSLLPFEMLFAHSASADRFRRLLRSQPPRAVTDFYKQVAPPEPNAINSPSVLSYFHF